MPRRRPTLQEAEGWHLSRHAVLRAAELGYSEEEVIAAARHPSTSYETDPRKYGPGQFVYKRGDVAVVAKPETHEVITVLLPRTDRWTHGKDSRKNLR